MRQIQDILQRGWGQMLEQQVGGAASGAIGGLLGLGFEGAIDQNQIAQQGALDQVQINAQQQMNQVNVASQEQLWNYTSQANQVKNIEAAGLNPALMYGGSGPGGQTANLQSGNVNGAAAGSSQGAVMGIMANTIAGQQAMADINLKNTTAKKIASDTPTTGNTGNANLDLLKQGLNNKIAEQTLTEAQTNLTNTTNDINEQSSDAQIQQYQLNTAKTLAETASAMVQAGIDQSTVEQKIQLIKTNLVGQMLMNMQTKAQTQNIQQGTQTSATQAALNTQLTAQSSAQINKMAQDIAQGWQGLDNQQKIMKVNGIIDQQKAMVAGRSGVGGAFVPMSAETMAKQIDAILGTGQQNQTPNQPKPQGSWTNQW